MSFSYSKSGLTAALILTAGMAGAAEAPQVVVSIKPIHALVAGVMDRVGYPTLLVQGGASPHSYALKPSSARALRDAGIVFWVGAELETFLPKALGAHARKNSAIELAKAAGVKLLRVRRAGDEKDHAGHHHGDSTNNMHLWLDPANAKAMVTAIGQALTKADPINSSRYQANAKSLHDRLDALDARLRGELAAVRTAPYIVFHDAYRYFEHRYGLNMIGAITVSPEAKPGAKRVYEMRRKLRAAGAVCAFTEPQFEPALVKTIVRGSSTRIGILDPLGAGIEPGKDAYFTLMKNLADSFRHCLLRATPPAR